MPSRVQQPSSNPYGGGVVLDSTPYLQLHLQKQAEEKAKIAAGQKAYEDLMKDPNPDGLREVDTKGFYDRANQWRQFGIQNKDAIKDPSKDNGAARNQFMKMANEISLYTQSSKSRKEHEKQFAPLFQNPETARRLKKSFLQQYGQLQSPLDTSTTFQFDPNNMFRAKDYDEKKELEAITFGLKPDELKIKQRTKDPLVDKEVTTITYSKPKLIGDAAKSRYKSSDSMQEYIDDLWDNEGVKTDASGKIVKQPSALINEFNQLHQKYYGKPIQTAEDLAAAYAIQKTANIVKKEDFVKNEKATIDYKNALDKKMKEYEHDLKAMDEKKQGIWVDNYIKNTLVKNASIRDIDPTEPSEAKALQSYRDIKLSPIEAKALTRDGQTPDRLKVDEKTNTFYPVYFEYADGKPLTDDDGRYKVNKNLSTPLTYEQFKISLIDAAPKNAQTVREMNKGATGKKEIKGFD